jgi:hypothetical protein
MPWYALQFSVVIHFLPIPPAPLPAGKGETLAKFEVCGRQIASASLKFRL